MTLKRNAARRKKIFSISLEYFREFCYRSDYIQRKGVYKESYTIDCIDPELGYAEGNIRAIPNHENARKGNRKLFYDYQTGNATVGNINPFVNNEGPF